MAVLDPIKPTILSARAIPNVQRDFAAKLGLTDEQRSVGILTCDIDDSLYVALDEATKAAEVEVVYARSFYAGSDHASGPLSGEVIGILAGPDPAEVRAGLNAAIDYAENEAWFHATNDAGDLAFFAHTLSRTGRYLSKEAGVEEGTPLSYLIAPPIEATIGVDAALKAAEVQLQVWFEPPSETNFSGAMLSGTQSACRAASQAFQDAVLDVARDPHKF